MKRLLCALVALSLVSGPTGSVVAAEGYAKKKAHKKKRAARKREPSAGTYYERDANKLPYGTWTWWEQMDREGRGGQQPGGSFD
jgi:hypothetical protein